MSSELLEKYLQGLCTESEKELVEDWYSKLENREKYPHVVPATERSQLLADALKNISEQIDEEEDRSTEVKRFPWYWLTGIAASVLLVLGLYYFQPLSQKNGGITSATLPAQSTVSILHFENKESRIIRHQLPDGSMVWMHKGASITYPEVFAANNRTVHFKGEAFFNIKKNKASPFLIKSDEMTVRVLGTSFNVKAAAQGKRFEISVVTGSVQVTTPDQESNPQRVILKPNQQAIFETGPKKLIAQNIPFQQKREIYQPISIKFNNSSINDVIGILEKKFDITIKLSDDKISQCRLNADFEQQPLPEILEMLCRSLEATYTIKGNLVVIDGTPCE